MNTLLLMTGLLFWVLPVPPLAISQSQFNIGATPDARNGAHARCREMSKDVRQCPQRRAGSVIAPEWRRLRSTDYREHIALAEQRAAAGRALTSNLAGHQPSIDCAHINTAQPGDLPFRQQLLVGRVLRRHETFSFRALRRVYAHAGRSHTMSVNARAPASASSGAAEFLKLQLTAGVVAPVAGERPRCNDEQIHPIKYAIAPMWSEYGAPRAELSWP
jgi:hypothetical protein